MGRRRGDRPDRAAPTGSVGSGAGHLFISRLIVAVAGWVGTIIIVRNLSAAGWGGYSYVFGLLGIIGVVVDLQVGRIVLREVIDADDDVGPIVGSYVCLRLLIGVVALTVAIAVVVIGGYERSVILGTVVAGLGYLFISPANGLIVWFQARLWLRPVAVSNVLAAITQLGVVGVVAMAAHPTLVGFASAFVFSQVVILVWRARVLLQHHVRVRLQVHPGQWWRWTKEAIPLTIGIALVNLYYKIDIVMLGELDSLEAVGQYSIGYKFADLASSLSLAFFVPLMTVMIAAWPDNAAAMRRYFRQATTVLFLSGTFITVGFALTADPVIRLLYGDRYAESAAASRFLVAGAVAQAFSYLCYVALLAVGRNRPYAIAGIVGVFVNVALNFALIPSYSYEGSALATVITEMMVLLLLGLALRQTRGVISIPWRVTAGIVGASAGMTGVYLAIETVAPWPVAAAGATGAFVALLHLFGAEEPGGIRAFIRALRFDIGVESARGLDSSSVDPPAPSG